MLVDVSVAPATWSETGVWASEGLRLAFGEPNRPLLYPKPSMCVPDTVRDGGLARGGDDGVGIGAGVDMRS